MEVTYRVVVSLLTVWQSQDKKDCRNILGCRCNSGLHFFFLFFFKSKCGLHGIYQKYQFYSVLEIPHEQIGFSRLSILPKCLYLGNVSAQWPF